MHCKIVTATKFRSKLGFNQHDIILSKGQSVLKPDRNIDHEIKRQKALEKKNLIVNLLELILMKKILIYLKS